MRKLMALSALLVAVVTVVATVGGLSAQANPYLGRWNITGTGPDVGKVYFLEVRQEGDGLAGLFLDRGGHATPVSWIKVENGELQWQYGGGGETLPKPACGPLYRAKIEGGTLVGQHTTPGTPCPPRAGAAAAKAAPKAAPAPQTVHWVGVRQPTWPPANANGSHTYGAPVVIVGPGVGKEVWTGLSSETSRSPCVDRWTMTDGLMTNQMPGPGERSTCNPYTRERFKDFRIQAEFNLGEGQNSGLYLRGRYELQLMLQRPDQPPAVYPGRLMDIYGWKRADVYAGNPPGEWQVLDAVIVGNRLTATLNGKKVHDNAVLAAFTGGALDNDELAPGPIMIQGDHSLVSFRKLVVTPITTAGS